MFAMMNRNRTAEMLFTLCGSENKAEVASCQFLKWQDDLFTYQEAGGDHTNLIAK